MTFIEKFTLIFTNARYLDSMLTGLRMTLAISVGASVLGLVLGSMFEGEIRRALRLSSGNPSIFFTRPISCVILLMGVGVIVSQVIKTYKEAQAASK